MPAASTASVTGARVAVLLAGSGDAVAEELGRTERHAPIDVLVGQLRLPRPHRLAQPAVEGQPVAGAAHERHGRVPVAVDQSGHEHAAELAHLGAGAAASCQGSPTQEMTPPSISTAPGASTVSSASTVKTASATSRSVMARRRTTGRTGRARRGSPRRRLRPSPPRCPRRHGPPTRRTAPGMNPPSSRRVSEP